VIQKEIACKDCEQLDCKDNICMDLITIDDLLDAVDKIFAGVKL